MIRVFVLLCVSGLLLPVTSAQARIFDTESMAVKLEPFWGPIFGGGIVFGLAVFTVLKLWRAIKRTRHQ